MTRTEAITGTALVIAVLYGFYGLFSFIEFVEQEARQRAAQEAQKVEQHLRLLERQCAHLWPTRAERYDQCIADL